LLATVVAPATFSPSQLGVADECLLRAVLGSARGIDPLPAHPAAEVGTAFHLLLERAIRGEIARRGTAEEDARRELDAILVEANERFAARLPESPPADLRDVWTPLAWRRKVRLVLDLAVRHMERGGAAAPVYAASSMQGGGGLSLSDLGPVGTWAEVRMRAPDLRIAGRADVVERSRGQVTIRDLKTGRVTEADGAVRPHLARQLRVYGLMARRQAPAAVVRLVVDDGTERDVPFGPHEEAETETWVKATVARVPSGVPVAAERLARFGPACDGCGFRHVCPEYRRRAPEAGRSGATHRLPLDTWGTLAEVGGAGDRRRLRLVDAAGRSVSVTGLLPARTTEWVAGQRVYLFGLRTRDRHVGQDVVRQPLNFHETTVDDRHDRAWALAAFHGESAH
jgi:RecB family exonuclease